MFDKMFVTIQVLRATMHDRLTERVGNEEGATAVEYGLMVALIAVVIIATVQALGLSLQGVFGDVDGAVSGATT